MPLGHQALLILSGTFGQISLELAPMQCRFCVLCWFSVKEAALSYFLKPLSLAYPLFVLVRKTESLELSKRDPLSHQAKVTISRGSVIHFHCKGKVNNMCQASLAGPRQYLKRGAPAVTKVCQNVETKYFHLREALKI